MSDIVVVIPKSYPGPEKFAAIRVQLRILGMPAWQVPEKYQHLLDFVVNSFTYNSVCRTQLDHINCYALRILDNKFYHIKRRNNP